MHLTQIFGTQGSGVLWLLQIKKNSCFSYFTLLPCLNAQQQIEGFSTPPPPMNLGVLRQNTFKWYLLNRTTKIDPLPYCFRGNQWIQICACVTFDRCI